MLNQSLFITGTDTGCGKTFITIWLAKRLQKQKIDVGVMKPISAGPKSENDAQLLKKTLKLKDSLKLINPVCLKYPLAPWPAAKLENKKISLKEITKSFKILQARHQIMLVEGIGGLLVPITEKYLLADLIKELKLPALIVARAGLGTINHTLLTVEALNDRKIPICGIILNGFRGEADLSEKSNKEVIEKISGLPVLASLPWEG